MSYTKQSIATNSSEPEFLKAFAAALTSADSRITCNTNIDEQFLKETFPEIIFNIEDNFYIKMTRVFAADQTGDKYRFDCYSGDKCIYSTEIRHSLYASGRHHITKRCFNFIVVSNESTLYIAIDSYENPTLINPKLVIINLHNEKFSAIAMDTGVSKNICDMIFNYSDQENANLTFKFYNRLNYEIDSNKVEIIKNKAVIDSAEAPLKVKSSEYTGLIDCSSVNCGSFINTDDEQYYAIDKNTLIKF